MAYVKSYDDRLFFCTFRNNSYNGNLLHVIRHAESNKHKENCKLEKNKLNEDVDMIDESLLSFKERKKIAEIRYAAWIADRNIPFQTVKDILNFFQEVGKDSNVLCV